MRSCCRFCCTLLLRDHAHVRGAATAGDLHRQRLAARAAALDLVSSRLPCDSNTHGSIIRSCQCLALARLGNLNRHFRIQISSFVVVGKGCRISNAFAPPDQTSCTAYITEADDPALLLVLLLACSADDATAGGRSASMVSMHCASQVTLVEAFLLFRNTSACKGNGLCVRFFYVCPEPVLVN